jgi:electron transfer flavoprotein beta subunit
LDADARPGVNAAITVSAAARPIKMLDDGAPARYFRGIKSRELVQRLGDPSVPYDSIVCVKQVPDTANVTADAMKENGTVNRAALPAIFNPEDLHALEAALHLRDRFGGTVTAITMGPLNACEVLRECLHRGADRAILITDRRAAGSDTLATGYILSQAVRKIENYDFVFCGRQAIDGDTAQVGPQMAEKLGIPQITYFEQLVELDNRTVRVRRDVGNGWEVLETRLPVALTVLDTANLPRPQAARRVMKFKRARCRDEVAREIRAERPDIDDDKLEAELTKRTVALQVKGLLMEQWDLDHIEADLQWCGLNGSPTKVHRIQSIVLTKEGYTEVPPTQEGVRNMVHELIVDHTLG